VEAARCQLAAAFTEDLRAIDAAIRDTRKQLAIAVQAAGTSLTGLFGVGPVIAAAVIGEVRHVSRFPGRDHFAACNGTAPIEVSPGGRKIWRLSRRGNRRHCHAIHMAAVTQIRHRHSQGRAYFEKKLAEGKTRKEALRALKRQISDAIYACLQADARRAATGAKSPGGQWGSDSLTSAADSHPRHRLFGKATPGPATHPTTPVDTAADPVPAAFPAQLPARASGRPGPGPGQARPRSGARRASLTRPSASR
jgi:transposase